MSAARISTTILASMWACTRTSACMASLRYVHVYVPKWYYVVPIVHVYEYMCTDHMYYVHTFHGTRVLFVVSTNGTVHVYVL
jgi:hypothetical protein